MSPWGKAYLHFLLLLLCGYKQLSWIAGQRFIPSSASLICSAVVSSFSDVLGVALTKENGAGLVAEDLEDGNRKERVERINATELRWEEVPL